MTTSQSAVQYEVLDPCLLGRPVHRLPVFAAQLREDLAQSMRLNVHRRYWGTFQVDDVAFARLDGSEARQRWLGFAAPSGQLGFALERNLLLSVLNYRYGRATRADAAMDEQAVRVTATEERLAVVLGQQLASILSARIESKLPEGSRDGGDADGIKADAAAGAASHPAKGSWVIAVSLRDGELQGKAWFSLDKQMMGNVLRGLLPERDASKKGSKNPGPLAARLQVGVSGRLVSKETTLGAMFDLRVGDVIPISLHRADVMLEDSRLFTAAVTEHKGKLCLTSFEDIE
ncbi:FliM/FliN family flagellar motor switch protein [Pseudoduganella violaceinigra]|uniref:FliM/FliN family flagellar motor switch protein n=1 Tax=Pseudoduganella violaceinigra TaxID=246602 RepID=UPI0004299C9A|nr:FliM/FliN family flagellar motor switch protein [Pseudoduganella violaceinigra]